MDVHHLAPQHALTAVVSQPTHGRVGCDRAVDDWQVQEVDLALGYARAARLLRAAQQALGISDVGAQTHTRTPAVLCVCYG